MKHKVKLPAKLQPLPCSDLIRVGRNHDGGYVVSTKTIEASDGLLSFGLNDDWSFEPDYYSLTGAFIHAFDGSISERLFKRNFFKSIISGYDFELHFIENWGGL